jgi:hypothetical protein
MLRYSLRLIGQLSVKLMKRVVLAVFSEARLQLINPSLKARVSTACDLFQKLINSS